MTVFSKINSGKFVAGSAIVFVSAANGVMAQDWCSQYHGVQMTMEGRTLVYTGSCKNGELEILQGQDQILTTLRDKSSFKEFSKHAVFLNQPSTATQTIYDWCLQHDGKTFKHAKFDTLYKADCSHEDGKIRLQNEEEQVSQGPFTEDAFKKSLGTRYVEVSSLRSQADVRAPVVPVVPSSDNRGKSVVSGRDVEETRTSDVVEARREAQQVQQSAPEGPEEDQTNVLVKTGGLGWRLYNVVEEKSSGDNIYLKSPGADANYMTYTKETYNNSNYVIKEGTSVWVQKKQGWKATSVENITLEEIKVTGVHGFQLKQFVNGLSKGNIRLSEPVNERLESDLEGRSTKSSDNQADKLNSQKTESRKAGKSSKSSNASEEKVKSVTVQESGPVSCSAACGILVAVIACIVGVFVCICLKKADSSARTSSGSGFAGYSTTGENANGDRAGLLKNLDDNSLESAWGEDY